MCFGIGFCQYPGDANSFVYVDAWTSLTCPNLTPSVSNTARTDGTAGGQGMSSDALAMTSTFRVRGHGWALSYCNGSSSRDVQTDPSVCNFTPGPSDGSVFNSPDGAPTARVTVSACRIVRHSLSI